MVASNFQINLSRSLLNIPSSAIASPAASNLSSLWRRPGDSKGHPARDIGWHYACSETGYTDSKVSLERVCFSNSSRSSPYRAVKPSSRKRWNSSTALPKSSVEVYPSSLTMLLIDFQNSWLLLNAAPSSWCFRTSSSKNWYGHGPSTSKSSHSLWNALAYPRRRPSRDLPAHPNQALSKRE